MTMSLPANEEEITPEWLTEVLHEGGALPSGRVAGVDAVRIAEGVGLMGRLARLSVRYEGAGDDAPASVIAKFPTEVPQNLQVAQLYRFYDRECDFYSHGAEHSPMRVPRAYAEQRDGSGGFVLLLEDLMRDGVRVGDQIAGNTPEDALAAIRALAEHHAAFWGRTAELDWLVDQNDPTFCAVLKHSYAGSIGPTLEGFGEHFSPALREVAQAVGQHTDYFMNLPFDEERPLTLAHGDFRADNVFYGVDGGLAVVDWQISGRGYGPFDLGYHLTQSVTSDTRRAIEKQAVADYHRALCAHGVEGYSAEQCWEDYREAALFCIVYPMTLCGALDLSIPRARALAEVFLTRSLDAIAELNAADKLPA
jgi:hypothetical protein